MSDYDFSTLNDKEFEILATDLLSKRDNVKYERFKPGRDAGVDGRFFIQMEQRQFYRPNTGLPHHSNS